MGQSAHDKLRYAQALLGHQLPSGDIAAVFERALDALIRQLEKRKFAATQAPRAVPPRSGGPRQAPRRSTGSPRYIPALVKRTVWERDQGQCTFVSQTGRRCPARTRLEFDHVHEVARGGETSVAGIRLRCRAHNQYTAERTFGTEFMCHKRRAAAEMRTAAKAHAAARASERAAAEAHSAAERQAVAESHAAAEGRAVAEARAAQRRVAQGQAAARARAQAAVEATAAEHATERDVVPWLRQLGFNAAEARRAAALCEVIPDASLEERVRRALSFFHVKGRVIRPVEALETETHGQPAGIAAGR